MKLPIPILLPRDALLARYVLLLCVCLSVTSQSSTEMAKPRITQTTPHNSPGILFFWCQKSLRNSNRITHSGGTK